MADVAELTDLALRLTANGPPSDDGAAQLAARAAGDRDALTASRDHFIDRLRARADDFAASRALGLVHKAIALTPRTGILIVDGRHSRRT